MQAGYPGGHRPGQGRRLRRHLRVERLQQRPAGHRARRRPTGTPSPRPVGHTRDRPRRPSTCRTRRSRSIARRPTAEAEFAFRDPRIAPPATAPGPRRDRRDARSTSPRSIDTSRPRLHGRRRARCGHRASRFAQAVGSTDREGCRRRGALPDAARGPGRDATLRSIREGRGPLAHTARPIPRLAEPEWSAVLDRSTRPTAGP